MASFTKEKQMARAVIRMSGKNLLALAANGNVVFYMVAANKNEKVAKQMSQNGDLVVKHEGVTLILRPVYG